ncbi:MAG: lysophospholipid acyltransferase family protein [Planctomycetota bacterium]
MTDSPIQKDGEDLVDAKNERGVLKDVRFPSSKVWSYFYSRFFLKYLPVWPFFRVAGVHTERLPATGGVILACNHASFIDPLVTGIAIRRPLRYFARATLFRSYFVRTIIGSNGAIPMERGSADFKAMRQVVDMLKNGEVVVVYPEGTRTYDGELCEFTPGASSMALMADAPLLPVYNHGTYESLGRGKKLTTIRWFLKHRVLFGEPIRPSDIPSEIPKRDRKDWLTTELVRQMKALEAEARTRWPLRDYSLAANQISGE